MHVRRSLAALLVALTLGVAVTSRPVAQQTSSLLEGVWQRMDGTDAQPIAGLYIFKGTHYSMVAAATNRPDITDINSAGADELRTVFGPLIANTGRFEISGDLVTIRPIAAKFPVVMKAGANEVYAFRVEGNMLYLTQRRNARGVEVQGAMPARLVRVE
jgi:hypothetical protein